MSYLLPPIPIGVVLPFAGGAAPDGFLACDGAAVSRGVYAALFAVIGITYGAGDGVATFNLPDLRGRFPLGVATAGTGSTLGASGGAIDHTHGIGTIEASDESEHTHGFASGTPSATSNALVGVAPTRRRI